MSAVNVRKARESDLEPLLALYEGLAGAKRSARPADADVSAGVMRQVLEQPSRHLLVAEIDGELVGTADMVIVPNLTHHGRPWAIVENVVVAERHRRRGVAGALFAQLFELARSSACCKVQLVSGKQRGGAHAFYRGVGMQAVAEGFKLYLDE